MTQQKLPEKLSFVLNFAVKQPSFFTRVNKLASDRAEIPPETDPVICPSDIMKVLEENIIKNKPQPGRINLPVMFNEYQAVIEEMVSRLYPEPNGENNYEKLKILFDTE